MNYCWNRWHLVGAYGAFGSVTKERFEIVVEGEKNGEWKEYEFKGKPTALHRIPGVFAPYHLRLDWLMWFLPFSVGRGFEPWFVNFLLKLLKADHPTLKLLSSDPWKGERPDRVRAKFYRYHFTPRGESSVWSREYIDMYFPAIGLSELEPLLQR